MFIFFALNLQQVRAFVNLKREKIYPRVSPGRDIVAHFCKRQPAILCVFSSSVHLPAAELIKCSFVVVLANYFPLLQPMLANHILHYITYKIYISLHIYHTLHTTSYKLISSCVAFFLFYTLFWKMLWRLEIVCFQHSRYDSFYAYNLPVWVLAFFIMAGCFPKLFPNKDKCLVIFCNLIKTRGLKHKHALKNHVCILSLLEEQDVTFLARGARLETDSRFHNDTRVTAGTLNVKNHDNSL